MTQLAQRSFAGGALAPNLYGRTDLSKWQAGLAQCQNFQINRFGNLENRPGTEFCISTINAPRQVEFAVSTFQDYDLVFYIDAFYHVTLPLPRTVACAFMVPLFGGQPFTVDSATQAAWSNATTYQRGQIVSYGGQCWTSLIDNNLNITPAAPTAMAQNWFSLGSGVVRVVVPMPEIQEPNFIHGSTLTQQLFQLTFAQINQTLFLANQTFYPMRLDYHSDTWWRFSTEILKNTIGRPTTLAATAGAGGSTVYKNTVVGVGSDNTTQGPIAIPAAGLTVTSIVVTSTPNPLNYAVTTSTNHGLTTGDVVEFLGGTLVGALQYNRQYSVSVTGLTTFTLNELVAPTAGTNTTYTTSLPTVYPTFVQITATAPTITAPNHISWTASANAVRYLVFEYYEGVWAFIGSTSATAFDDIGITPDLTQRPAVNIPMFQTPQDYPAVVGVYQQRLWYANTINQPQSYWASRVGQYGVFNVNTPTNAADAFTFVLAGTVVQYITGFADIGRLVCHTTQGEYIIAGDASSGSITPTAQNVQQIGNGGSYPGIRPLPMHLTDLFVQFSGRIIRDLQFDVQVFNYTGKDTTLFASHLFKGKTIVDWCWAQVPNSIVWCVMSDGTVNAMTYIKEHQMWAWHQHVFAEGKAVSICCTREGNRSVVYFAIASDTGTYRIERQSDREYLDLNVDANFLDCAYRYNGMVATGSNPLVPTTSGGWTPSDVITLTSASPVFLSSNATYQDVVIADLLDANGNVTERVAFRIVRYVNPNVVDTIPEANVPAWAQISISTWGIAKSHFSGAVELAGYTVGILGDGNVDDQTTVANDGSFVTTKPYLNVWVGIPVTAQAQTLDWEDQQGETIMGKQKNINELTCVFVASRGGLYGMDLTAMAQFPSRQNEPWDTSDDTLTGPVRFPLTGEWAPTAQVYLQQMDPLPLCLSALVQSGQTGQ